MEIFSVVIFLEIDQFLAKIFIRAMSVNMVIMSVNKYYIVFLQLIVYLQSSGIL